MNHWNTKNGLWFDIENVGITQKALVRRSIVHDHALARFLNIAHDGVGKSLAAFQRNCIKQIDFLNVCLSGNDQPAVCLLQKQSSLCAGIFESNAHQFAQQLFKDNLDRNGTRSLRHGSKIQGSCCALGVQRMVKGFQCLRLDAWRRIGGRDLTGWQTGKHRFKMSGLGGSTPFEESLPRLLQIQRCNFKIPSLPPEPAVQLTRQSFMVEILRLSCVLNCLFIGFGCLSHPAAKTFQSRREPQRGTSKVLRTITREHREVISYPENL